MQLGLATFHAVQRYRERVADIPEEQVVAVLSTPVIQQAIAMGCRAVKLSSGHRAVIADGRIVTVHPKHAQWI